MEEQLILFETAKLAKKKGFNWVVRSSYNDDFKLPLIDKPYNWNNFTPKTTSAPTQSLLQKWLREVHNIHLKDFHPKIEDFGIDIIGYFPPSIYYDGKTTPLNNNYYKTYEEALEAGLFEALNFIK